MPNLRRLECGMMPGLEAVAGCKQLREIELYVKYDGEARTAAEFLRRATQLVKLTLEYESPTDMAPFSDMDFVLALATTGRSHLEELELNVEDINDMGLEHFPQQQSLLRALPRLPALKTLEVKGEASDELLLGVTPANAPALRSLKVLTVGVKCAHDALHRGAVQILLSLNPDLKFSTHELSYCYTDDRCAWCTLGCHQEMRQDLDPPLKHSADWVTIPRL
ncbi:uncharacterized protein LOC113211245 [Frankliniella occidentalis]|uniref:Uncharacterized protein LOC113211245 n=1 Tax=Frankliniella occidentalis TaxID=133901 RepID=A0A9C6U0S5_FRAOC|nr:uncharacterized protein LOC113211245 [Frankliniella occidentalis]